MSTAETEPLVLLMRRLSEQRLSTYASLVHELESLGFEQLKIDIPVRRDVVKFAAGSIHRKGDVVVQLSSGTGSEGGFELSHISISIMDKTAPLDQTVKDVSQWLGMEPEYPAKAAQFVVLESDAGWIPIPLADTKRWPVTLKGALAHISVDDMGFGVSVSRIVQRAL